MNRTTCVDLRLQFSISVFIYLYSTLHSLQVKKKEILLILVSQEIFERKLVVHFFA